MFTLFFWLLIQCWKLKKEKKSILCKLYKYSFIWFFVIKSNRRNIVKPFLKLDHAQSIYLIKKEGKVLKLAVLFSYKLISFFFLQIFFIIFKSDLKFINYCWCKCLNLFQYCVLFVSKPCFIYACDRV